MDWKIIPMMRVFFDDDQLLKMIGSIRDHPSLERLHLGQYDHTSLNISHVGCEAIAPYLVIQLVIYAVLHYITPILKIRELTLLSMD